MMFHNHVLYSMIYNTFIYLASHLPTDTKDFPLSKPASPHMTSKLIIPETTSVLTSHQLFLSPLDFPYQHTKLLKYHFCLQRRKAFQFPPANNSFSTLPYSKIFRLVCCHYCHFRKPPCPLPLVFGNIGLSCFCCSYFP